MNNPQARQNTAAIIGGGPAGMGCALWLKQLGFNPVIIEQQDDLGGQARTLKRVNQWYLGQWNQTSSAISETYSNHIRQTGIETKFRHTLLSARHADSGELELTLSADGGQPATLPCRALIIATGQHSLGKEVFRQLPGYHLIDSESCFSSFPLDHLQLEKEQANRCIVVLGGGDNAYCTALDVVQRASKVTLIMRSLPRAQRRFQTELEPFVTQGKIEICTHGRIVGFRKTEPGIAITVEKADNSQLTYRTDRIFARLGFIPNTRFLDDLPMTRQLKRTASGYIIIDTGARTSVPSVYAAGDVTGSQPSSMITSLAQGAVAAHSVEQDSRTIN